ncbi:small subunit of acetolactate synthase [Tenacibaculum adriaticum]|uniref:Small subunit of acetolactate synthase n=1 Tax=Tenacibaculum adriaticum TaxID=413713 RepID=A0A5S5DWI0_9FLAO|nr:hypothetical protein [Tenacibaculum adriaticum]TYQ00202.1 small subunit of acetolactate synthase [Tenacibaculum adriaticum]
MESESLTLYIETVNWNKILPMVLNVFQHRKIKLDTIQTSKSALDKFGLIIIEIWTSQKLLQNVIEEIQNIDEVKNVNLVSSSQTLQRCVTLFQFDTKVYLEKNNFQEILNLNNAKVIDINKEYTIVEKICDMTETNKLIQKFKHYNLIQCVMSNQATLLINRNFSNQ